MIASVGFKPINETTEDEDLRKFLAKQSKKQTGLVTEICKGYPSQVFERLLNVVKGCDGLDFQQTKDTIIEQVHSIQASEQPQSKRDNLDLSRVTEEFNSQDQSSVLDQTFSIVE